MNRRWRACSAPCPRSPTRNWPRCTAGWRKTRAADGLLDVAYRTLDTPVGTLLLAATSQGLVRIAFPGEGHDQVLEMLAAQVSPRILSAPGQLDAAAREIDEYFAGQRRSFYLPLDYRLATGFRRQVLGHLPDIGYGHTASYAAVAAAVGSPGRCAPWAPPAPPTRCPWWCPATGWSGPTASSATTAAARGPSGCCSSWRQHDGRPGRGFRHGWAAPPRPPSRGRSRAVDASGAVAPSSAAPPSRSRSCRSITGQHAEPGHWCQSPSGQGHCQLGDTWWPAKRSRAAACFTITDRSWISIQPRRSKPRSAALTLCRVPAA